MTSRRTHPGVSTNPPPATIASASPPRQAPPAPTQAQQAQAQFELGVALALALWPALTLAVQQQWGGPSSADKRDWFTGAVIDLFESRFSNNHPPSNHLPHYPSAARQVLEVEDVEEFLLQVMLDEFEVNVDDESGMQTAELVVRLWRDCGKGEFGEVRGLRERWEAGGRRAGEGRWERVVGGDGDEDEEEDSDEDDQDDQDDQDEEEGDVEMGDASPERPRERMLPQVDEDGFTRVTGKKKR